MSSALQLRLDDASALDTRAHIFETLGRREEATSYFRRALSRDPNQKESAEGLKRLGAAP
jgi:Tfp pilus assembly protein PilF